MILMMLWGRKKCGLIWLWGKPGRNREMRADKSIQNILLGYVFIFFRSSLLYFLIHSYPDIKYVPKKCKKFENTKTHFFSLPFLSHSNLRWIKSNLGGWEKRHLNIPFKWKQKLIAIYIRSKFICEKNIRISILKLAEIELTMQMWRFACIRVLVTDISKRVKCKSNVGWFWVVL